MIKAIIERNKLLLLLIVIFILAEVIVNPIADLPLNDDWCYGKSVKNFLETGKIEIDHNSSTTLWTQVVWGGMFTKLFGFSFTALRFSTLISVLVGLILLYKLVLNISQNKFTAVIASAVLLFNPIYFNLSNTFMTDANFITLLIVCIYFAFNFFSTQSIVSLLLFFVFATLTVLLRQLGVIVPVCFLLTCLFLKNKKWVYTSIALILTAVVFMVLNYYENYLRTILPPSSAYQFSGGASILSVEFWDKLYPDLWRRICLIILHSLFYSFPFVIIFIPGVFRRFSKTIIVETFALNLVLCYVALRIIPFPTGNVFCNGIVGAETFVQTFFPNFDYEDHNYIYIFDLVMPVLKYLFSAATLTVLVLWVFTLLKRKTTSLFKDPRMIFLFGLYFSYIFGIFVLFTVFDRYLLPFILLTILLLSFIDRSNQPKISPAIAVLLLFFYVSVFGTKDYLELNRKRWEAYYFLKDTCHTNYNDIDGGNEVCCWNDGKPTEWHYFLGFNNYHYLIQYNIEPGFKRLRTYEFQRYFPYRKDKIFIFMNLHKKKAL